MKQTAVEWLEKELNWIEENKYTSYIELKIKQAKEMEKEQSFEIFKAGQESMEEGGKGFEQYYNETFIR